MKDEGIRYGERRLMFVMVEYDTRGGHMWEDEEQRDRETERDQRKIRGRAEEERRKSGGRAGAPARAPRMLCRQLRVVEQCSIEVLSCA